MKGNGTVLCLPTTAGLWQGMPLPWNTSDRQSGGEKKKKEKKEKVISFALNNELT